MGTRTSAILGLQAGPKWAVLVLKLCICNHFCALRGPIGGARVGLCLLPRFAQMARSNLCAIAKKECAAEAEAVASASFHPVKSNDNVTEGASFPQMIMSLKECRSVKR
jgi:hypothetical protein